MRLHTQRTWEKGWSVETKPNTISIVKHEGGSIRLWGCFSSARTENLVKAEGKMDEAIYWVIIEKTRDLRLGQSHLPTTYCQGYSGVAQNHEPECVKMAHTTPWLIICGKKLLFAISLYSKHWPWDVLAKDMGKNIRIQVCKADRLISH